MDSNSKCMFTQINFNKVNKKGISTDEISIHYTDNSHQLIQRENNLIMLNKLNNVEPIFDKQQKIKS